LALRSLVAVAASAVPARAATTLKAVSVAVAALAANLSPAPPERLASPVAAFSADIRELPTFLAMQGLLVKR
jgi:hypothetical protein